MPTAKELIESVIHNGTMCEGYRVTVSYDTTVLKGRDKNVKNNLTKAGKRIEQLGGTIVSIDVSPKPLDDLQDRVVSKVTMEFPDKDSAEQAIVKGKGGAWLGRASVGGDPARKSARGFKTGKWTGINYS